MTWVYPRPRGEAVQRQCAPKSADGLSPPTRGSLPNPYPPDVPEGSIPAHAGKPTPGRTTRAIRGVYPRPRGEARWPFFGAAWLYGLSPPTRGSHLAVPARDVRTWSIPAHAGKPPAARIGPGRHGVYPRPRGEANGSKGARTPDKGLSPPTRGSQRVQGCKDAGQGSIPAHAGKPALQVRVCTPAKVYPRPRGEATQQTAQATFKVGLSPPTRGSRTCALCLVPCAWSIPAHAGKPRGRSRPSGRRSVYPRPRGEAGVDPFLDRGYLGLSPPTRGSRPSARRILSGAGSIPAHAGKPLSRRSW